MVFPIVTVLPAIGVRLAGMVLTPEGVFNRWVYDYCLM